MGLGDFSRRFPRAEDYGACPIAGLDAQARVVVTLIIYSRLKMHLRTFRFLTVRTCQSLICLLLLSFASQAQTLKSEYLNWIKIAADAGWNDYQPSIERWKKAPNNHELWGYDSPGGPIYLADLLGYLYQETKDRSYAEKARDI